MTTELAVLEPIEIDFFTSDDEASALGTEIEGLLASIRNHELNLATSYVKLGLMLLKVQTEKYWIQWGYSSFATYLGSIKDTIGRAHSQMYAYIGCAEKLLPSVSEENLLKMGISRAIELVRYVNRSGLGVPDHLLSAALDDNIKLTKLHSDVLEALHEKGELKGNWWEFGGFYCLPEERKEINAAIDRAKNIDSDLASMSDHQQRKELMLAWVREFMSSNPLERTHEQI